MAPVTVGAIVSPSIVGAVVSAGSVLLGAAPEWAILPILIMFSWSTDKTAKHRIEATATSWDAQMLAISFTTYLVNP